MITGLLYVGMTEEMRDAYDSELPRAVAGVPLLKAIVEWFFHSALSFSVVIQNLYNAFVLFNADLCAMLLFFI